MLRNLSGGGGGIQIIFWRDVRPAVWNPYPHFRIFLPQKMADLTVFTKFLQIGTHFQGVFLPQNGWFFFFFIEIFVKWDPLLRIFWPKLDPCLRIFGEKVTHLSGTSPYALTCAYTPPPPAGTYQSSIFIKWTNCDHGHERFPCCDWPKEMTECTWKLVLFGHTAILIYCF